MILISTHVVNEDFNDANRDEEKIMYFIHNGKQDSQCKYLHKDNEWYQFCGTANMFETFSELTAFLNEHNLNEWVYKGSHKNSSSIVGSRFRDNDFIKEGEMEL